MAQTVKDFVTDSYRLINPNSPTVPLHGNDMSKGIQYLNELLSSYSGTGLMLTIAKEVITPLMINEGYITFADASYIPAADVQQGRLANLQNAWVMLSGVTYPMIITNRNDFLQAYKYDPLQGLPRFCIVYPETDITTLRIYPAPSQYFQLNVYGKFELSTVGEDDTMAGLPGYYIRFLRFALARELCLYKSRPGAWTQELKDAYNEAMEDMTSVSSVNLKVNEDKDDYLNGAWRVRAGI